MKMCLLGLHGSFKVMKTRTFSLQGSFEVIKGFLLAVMILVLFSMPATGAEKRHDSTGELLRKEKSLEDVKRRIRQEKRAVRKITQKEVSILTELERINIALAGKKEVLRRASLELETAQINLLAASAEIERLENGKKALNGRLRLRLRAIYKTRGYEAVNILLPMPIDAGDSLGPGRMQRYMAAVTDSDRALIGRCEETIARLTAERERQRELTGALEGARKEMLAKKGEAEATQAEKTALLNAARREKEKGVGVVKELEEAAAGLADLVKKLRADERPRSQNAKGFAAMKGRLPMPVAGIVVSGYGKVRHPKFGTLTFNNGILIEAPEGRAVKSIYDGTAVYTGWLKGYGNIIILDHGDGYYTLFAHLLKTMKEKGDGVARGDVVGLVGSTGLESSPGLYFEIRERGVSRDPFAWLAAR
ncbi:MAG: peptidoglycan DD-metalloendopeptidase family protein [Deltaproteobacteria bacterium]|nr:peptidoglycan DD-metalloendopeptidase family protein [Deltaproteobacteria bacterium]